MIVTSTNSSLRIGANVVIVANIFSDIGASYVEFFGGRSTRYEKKMHEMYKCIEETLKQRVHAILEFSLSNCEYFYIRKF